MKALQGISASSGIVISKVYKIAALAEKIRKKQVEDVDSEVSKLNEALKKSKDDIHLLKEKTLKECGEDEAAIFEAHSLLLDDPEILDRAVKKIQSEKINASFVISELSFEYGQMFEQMDDDYLKARGADIKDVYSRVIDHLELSLIHI